MVYEDLKLVHCISTVWIDVIQRFRITVNAFRVLYLKLSWTGIMSGRSRHGMHFNLYHNTVSVTLGVVIIIQIVVITSTTSNSHRRQSRLNNNVEVFLPLSKYTETQTDGQMEDH